MDDNVKAGIETAIEKIEEAMSAAEKAEKAWDAADDAIRELSSLF